MTSATSLTAPSTRLQPGTGVARSSAVFISRSLRHSLRDGEGLLMAVALPVMLMLLFTLIFGGAIGGDGYIDFVVPGVILLCAAYGASSVAVSVNRDITLGAMRRFRTMPIRSATVLFGHVVASVLRNLLATAIVVGVAVAIGFRPGAGFGEWLAALGLVTAWILAITMLFAFIGLVSTSPEAANGYGFILLFLPYLSSAFVPISTMPSWLQPVARYQPINPLVEAIRGLLMGGTIPIGQAVTWCVGIVAVSLALIAWRFPKGRDR
ncbi:ABC transporter permease [Propionimicrobium sp. PCR01-08-3]|uniref:ABC transporter permease n=1 Tax=Propionimicrobium sp. PCR01-08-3 TaxID=3052086 RepID=UPI00255CE088|nr:ABC transporter permease [Propionimicrobium sp. PCR01-08-3]WIY83456.1 ABC transporter permease [Propionimicrobium sp. PCR01-08-3]